MRLLEELRTLSNRLLQHWGVPAAHADLQTGMMLEAELRGHCSLGLEQLPALVGSDRRQPMRAT